jgi:hypothetical protein
MAKQPWEKKPEEKGERRKLTAESIAWARERARAAGRRYPNLVDNMAAARRQAEQERGSGPEGPSFLRKL